MIAQTELTQQQKQNILRWYYTHPIKMDVPRPGSPPFPRDEGDDSRWEEAAKRAEQAVAGGYLNQQDESHLRVRPLPENMRRPLRDPILLPESHCLMGERDRDFFPSAAGLHNGGYILPVEYISETPSSFFIQQLFRSWMAHNFDLNMLMGDLEAAVNRDEVDVSLLRSIQAEIDVYTAIIQELGDILAQYALREERELYFQGYGWNTQKIEGQERVKIRDAAKHLLQECPGISQNKAAKTIANYCWCNRGVSTIKKHIKDLFGHRSQHRPPQLHSCKAGMIENKGPRPL